MAAAVPVVVATVAQGLPFRLNMAEPVGPFTVAVDPTHEDHLGPQKRDRLRALVPFYTEARLRDVVLPFLDDDGPVSLRHMNHLINHMARVRGISWTLDDGTVVCLHDTYRAWLRTWTRRLFDCFRRYERVYFHLDGRWHATTVGQLNFFFFAHRYGVLQFAERHRDVIDADMRAWNQKQRTARRTNTRPAPQPTAQAPVHTHVGSTLLQF